MAITVLNTSATTKTDAEAEAVATTPSDASGDVEIVPAPAGVDTSIKTNIIIPSGPAEDLLGLGKPTPTFSPKIPAAADVTAAKKMARVKRHLNS